MVRARTLILKGLIEGLVLSAIERKPAHGYGLLKDLEDVLGEAPNKNQVYPLLQRLELDGLLRAQDTGGDDPRKVYHLTRDGEARLREYRTASAAFKQRLVELFAITPGPALAEEAAARPAVPARGEADAPSAGPGWVQDRLGDLPRGPPVRAPFSRVSLNRQPGTGSWQLAVEHHEPGRYEGSEACPLTYLYLAAQRLLFTQE